MCLVVKHSLNTAVGVDGGVQGAAHVMCLPAGAAEKSTSNDDDNTVMENPGDGHRVLVVHRERCHVLSMGNPRDPESMTL